MKTPKPLHFNVPQIKVMLAGAKKNYLIMARGTGKSSGILSPWLVEQARTMPRSQGGIIGSTFQQLLVRTLPPAIGNWERMGYHRDVHYVIGHEPSKVFKRMWNWKGPHVKPLDSKYCMYWFNGSVQVLISQDRIGSSNGLSLAYLGGDEAKLLNKERLDDEVMPTLRGDRSHFGHLPNYRGEMFLTDMPTTAKSMWILDKAEQMDIEQITLILQLQLKVNLWKRDLLTAKSQEEALALTVKIHRYERELQKLRFKSVYYAEASALDNIDVLGLEFIADMRKTLSKGKFDASIMNIKPTKIEGGFYGLLDSSLHGSDWFNYNYLDVFIDRPTSEIPTNQDWKHDAGFDSTQPLEIAMDYGSDINCLVVGQEIGDEFRTLNSFYVLHPELTAAVVHKFCDYYEGYPSRHVFYYFDHTAISGNGVTEFTYQTVVEEALRSRGWSITSIYCGQAPSHDRKYELWGAILGEKDDRLPRFRYSKTNCQQLETSMSNAGVYRGSKGFQKDKRPERDDKMGVPTEDATHLSDAIDTLVFFKYHTRLEDSSTFVPSSTM